MPELETQLRLIWPVAIDVSSLAPETVDPAALTESLIEDAHRAYEERTEQFGEELMRYLERSILLQVIDTRWREHLYDMDYLREGIHLRGFAQIDPLVAYKNEGFSMFEELMHSIWEEFSRLIFHVEVDIAPSQAEEAFAPAQQRPRALDYSGGTAEAQPSALREVAAASGPTGPVGVPGVTPGVHPSTAQGPATGGGDGDGVVETKVKSDEEKIGRNDPCWCGSGKKYKKCHGA